MSKQTHKNILLGGIIVTISLLPGCALFDMFKVNNNPAGAASKPNSETHTPMTGEVLVKMKGKPAITTDTLATEKEKFFKSNPQMRQALAFMDPNTFDRNLLEGLIGQKIADEYVISQKIDQTAAYKNELEDLCDSMKRMLNAKYLSEKKSVTVSDAEVKSFYEENKDKLRGTMTSPGGVMATGIEFQDQSTALAFVAKAKSSPGGFKKAAQDDNLNAKIKDFKLVTDQSASIDEPLRDKIVAIKTVPTIEFVEAGGKFWVINATAKEEPKYVSYEQVKDKLKQELEQSKRVELFEKEIAALRQEYAVEVHEDYFKGKEIPLQELPSEEGITAGGVAKEPARKNTAPKRFA